MCGRCVGGVRGNVGKGVTQTHFPTPPPTPPYFSPYLYNTFPLTPYTLPHLSIHFFTPPTPLPMSFLTSPHTLHTQPIHSPTPSPTFLMYESVAKLPRDDVTLTGKARCTVDVQR